MVTGYLHCNGTKILDSNNNPVVLRGVAPAGWAIPSYTSEWTLPNFNEMATHGINYVRLALVGWGLLETSQPSGGITAMPTSSNFDAAHLTWFDKLASYCQTYGIYFKMDFSEFSAHDANYTNPGAGTNWPSWLTGVDSNPDTFETNFYKSSSSAYAAARTAFQNMLVFIAQRYAANPFVIIGLENEPFASNSNDSNQQDQPTTNAYISVCNQLYSAIYGTGYQNPVVICMPWSMWGTGTTKPTGANFIWEMHLYWNEPPATQTLAVWQSDVQYYFVEAYMSNFNMPIIIGELCQAYSPNWGVDITSSDVYTNTQAAMNTLASLGIAGSSWMDYEALYWGVSTDTGLFSTQAGTDQLLVILSTGSTGPVTITPTPPPQTLPFSDNFANLNNLTIIDGTWTLNSKGVQGSSTAEALAFEGNTGWTDYQITAPITITAGGEGSIVFRFKDSTDYYWAGLGPWGHQYSISKVVNGTYTELISSGLQSANPAGTYNLQVIVAGSNIELYVNGILVLTVTDTSLTSGAVGFRTFNSTIQVVSVNVTTPITPTYFVNWAITPTSGNLPFTISFSGYLSRFSSTPDAGIIVNGETIQIQAQAPGNSTWVNTGIAETTGSGPLGNGYFSGTWNLTEPGIYPGAWQFRAYYAGNPTKYLFGCDSKTRKRDLSRVNALIL